MFCIKKKIKHVKIKQKIAYIQGGAQIHQLNEPFFVDIVFEYC